MSECTHGNDLCEHKFEVVIDHFMNMKAPTGYVYVTDPKSYEHYRTCTIKDCWTCLCIKHCAMKYPTYD